MKQHLSVEQVTSLSPEAQQRLREWWKPQVGDIVISKKDNRPRILGQTYMPLGEFALQFHPYCADTLACDLAKLADCLPLLSIGQCLQLLLELDGKRALDVEWWTPLRVWLVKGECSDELIDALFAAVKAELEVEE